MSNSQGSDFCWTKSQVHYDCMCLSAHLHLYSDVIRSAESSVCFTSCSKSGFSASLGSIMSATLKGVFSVLKTGSQLF